MVTSDCLYMFEWETNVVCTETTPAVSTDCTFTDQRTQHLYDLTGLSKKAPATAGYKVRFLFAFLIVYLSWESTIQHLASFRCNPASCSIF